MSLVSFKHRIFTTSINFEEIAWRWRYEASTILGGHDPPRYSGQDEQHTSRLLWKEDIQNGYIHISCRNVDRHNFKLAPEVRFIKICKYIKANKMMYLEAKIGLYLANGSRRVEWRCSDVCREKEKRARITMYRESLYGIYLFKSAFWIGMVHHRQGNHQRWMGIRLGNVRTDFLHVAGTGNHLQVHRPGRLLGHMDRIRYHIVVAYLHESSSVKRLTSNMHNCFNTYQHR